MSPSRCHISQTNRSIAVSRTIEFTFTIVVEPDGRAFHAYCPALEGLHTDGDTQEEACRNAGDAAIAYIESLVKHHEPIPVDMIVRQPSQPGAFICRQTGSLQVAYA
jgi:predicted RNase H-like HicB family nuclease